MPVNSLLKPYATQLGFPDSEALAKIFDILFPGEDTAKVLMSMPGTVEDLAEKSGVARGRVSEIVEDLKSKGAIGHPMRKPEIHKRFGVVIELRDVSVLAPDCSQELFELWETVVTKEMPKMIELLKDANMTPLTRVIPIERSVEAQQTVLDIDSARKIFKDADLVSVLPCPCRLQAKKNGRGQDCPAPQNAVCMQTNGFAEAALNRGVAGKISTDEALKRVGEAEDAGLVHMIRNNVKTDMFMCNCCSCCCVGIGFINDFGFAGGGARSRFQVKHDPDACSVCGECEDRCQFHAIGIDGEVSIDMDKCYGCGNCVITCPDEALTLVEIRPKEHIRAT